MSNHSQQLGEAPIFRLLLRFTIPAVVATLINALYNVVDRIFIGQGVGTLGIAGVTIAFPVMLVNMAFGVLIGIGATSLLSIRLGEQKHDEAERILGNAVVLKVIIALATTTVGLTFLHPLLRILGASEAVLPYAQDYLQIILFGSVFQGISFGVNNFIRAEGNPNRAMVTMLIGAGLNIALDPLFIFVFQWGVRGAALATVISHAIAAVWVMHYYLSGRSTLRLRWTHMRLQPQIIKQIVIIGFPMFAMHLTSSVQNLILNRSLMAYGGDIAISGMGVMFSLVIFLVLPVLGISQGVQPIIGYNYGAKQYDRVKEALKQGILVATGVVTVGFIVTRLFPVQLISMFNPNDPELIAFGTRAMRIFFYALPIIGFQIVGSQYFQAVGKPKQAMILGLSRQFFVLIPAILILPRFYGLFGIFAAIPLSDVIATCLTAGWLFYEMRALGPVEPQAYVEAEA